ncbi:MAG: AAA family ATPase [Promethearchaeota archaeon]
MEGLIKEVYLKNFLLFDKIKVKIPSGITVLTGKNGTGKSLFLDALRLVLGLKSRTIRMERVSDYLRNKEEPAIIEILLRNPFKIPPERVFQSENSDFNVKYLQHNEIRIRREILPEGRTIFKIFNLDTNKFDKLSSDETKNLLEAYNNIGIDPNDELVFVPAEEFLKFIEESPEKRYKIFIDKLGIKNLEVEYSKIMEQLENEKDKLNNLKNQSIEIDHNLNNLEQVHIKWIEKQQKIKNLKDLEKLMDFVELREIEDIIDSKKAFVSNIETKIKNLNTNLNNKKEEFNKFKVEYKKIEEEYNQTNQKFEKGKEYYNKIKGAIAELDRQNINKNRMITNYQSKLAECNRNIGELREKINIMQRSKGDINLQEYDNLIQKYKEEIIKLNDKKTKLDEEYYNRYQEIKSQIEEEIKEIYNKITKLKDMVQKTKTYDKKGKIKSEKEIRANKFKQELQYRGLEDKVLGPFYQVVNIKKGYEKWKMAASYAVGNILFDFIALDRETFRKLHELRRSSKEFESIDIGFLETKNISSDRYIIDNDIKKIRKEAMRDVEIVHKILDGNEYAIQYARKRSGGNNILIDETDAEYIEKLSEKYNNKKFISIEGFIFDYAKGAARSPGKKKLSCLIGGGKSEINLDNKDIRQEIRKLEERRAELLRNKGKNLIKDPRLKQIQEEKSELDKQIGVYENKIKELEKEKIKKDPNVIIKNLNNELNKKKEEKSKLEERIKILLSEIEENDQEISEKQEKIEEFESKYKDLKIKLQKKSEEFEIAKEKYKKLEMEIKELEKLINEEEGKREKEQKNINELQNKLEILKKQLKDQKIPEKIPKKIILEDRIQQLKKEINKIKVTEKDEKEYQKLKHLSENIENKISEIEGNIQNLYNEGKKWNDKIKNTFDEKIAKINQIFNKILSIVGANGEIITSIDDKGIRKLYINVQYVGESKRSLEQHSSGQKQAGVIALVLALQSQCKSPIIAIDEFDKGLDPINKRNLMKKLPIMINQALELKDGDYKGIYTPQFLLICPDISINDITEDINLLTCIKYNLNTSHIQK